MRTPPETARLQHGSQLGPPQQQITTVRCPFLGGPAVPHRDPKSPPKDSPDSRQKPPEQAWQETQQHFKKTQKTQTTSKNEGRQIHVNLRGLNNFRTTRCFLNACCTVFCRFLGAAELHDYEKHTCSSSFDPRRDQNAQQARVLRGVLRHPFPNTRVWARSRSCFTAPGLVGQTPGKGTGLKNHVFYRIFWMRGFASL